MDGTSSNLGMRIDLDAPRPQVSFAPSFKTLEDKLAWIAEAGRDDELRAMILTALGIAPKAPQPVGLTPLSMLSALQVSVFDNRDKPANQRKRSERDFGLALESWTGSGDASKRNRTSATNVILFTAKELALKLKKNRSVKLTQDWIDSMSEMMATHGDTYLYGPVVSRAEGYTWVEKQFVMARLNSKSVDEVIIFHMDDLHPFLRITDFVTTYANGSDLSRGVMGTARVDFTGERDGWATCLHMWEGTQ